MGQQGGRVGWVRGLEEDGGRSKGGSCFAGEVGARIALANLGGRTPGGAATLGWAPVAVLLIGIANLTTKV
jgi:hypothetical protein